MHMIFLRFSVISTSDSREKRVKLLAQQSLSVSQIRLEERRTLDSGCTIDLNYCSAFFDQKSPDQIGFSNAGLTMNKKSRRWSRLAYAHHFCVVAQALKHVRQVCIFMRSFSAHAVVHILSAKCDAYPFQILARRDESSNVTWLTCTPNYAMLISKIHGWKSK